MAPLPPSGKLVGRYAEALHDYLKQPRESELRRAGDLGRDAMLSGLGLSEMSAIHHESVRALLAGILKIDEDAGRGINSNPSPCEDRCLSLQSLAAKEITPTLTAAANFFAESVSTFELNQREFRQSNTALRYQNGKLEDRVSRVSRVVFEEAMQLLAAAGLALDQAGRNLPDDERGNLDEVRNLLDRLGEQLAACSGDLRPGVLEDLGLRAAIQSLSRRFSAAGQIDITVDVADVAANPVRPEVGIVLYRAVQEALTNVVQHARAQHVKIRLWDEGRGLQCSVRDDGAGFDSSKLFSGIAEQGSGLISIWESLRLIGGALAINSSPGGGTEVAIIIGRNSKKQGPRHRQENLHKLQ
jgi:two-component system, NarL family, sensor histidine kinase UhpB